MMSNNTAERRNGPNWFGRWIATLALITTASTLALIALGIYGMANRPDQLPEIARPKVHHDGIYPAANQELTQRINVSVAPRHQDRFVNAIITDIEQSGGRVKRHDYNTVEAVALSSYVKRINQLRDNPDGPEHRNPRYGPWTERFASQSEAERQSKSRGEWTAFTVEVDRTYMPDQASAIGLFVAILVAVCSLVAILMSCAARHDIQQQNART